MVACVEPGARAVLAKDVAAGRPHGRVEHLVADLAYEIRVYLCPADERAPRVPHRLSVALSHLEPS